MIATLLVCLHLAQNNQQQVNMAEMMAKAKKFTQPGDAHKVLERFVGNWIMESQIVMPGAQAKPSVGEHSCSWMMANRWLECKSSGPFLGQQHQFHYIFGYDNFKMSYRVMGLTSLDTAMNVSEGDMDPSGKALITYGTIDEYLTGEHDKMVRYVWRFDSPDVIRMEVHDLPIGEKNTMVMSIKYTRKK